MSDFAQKFLRRPQADGGSSRETTGVHNRRRSCRKTCGAGVLFLALVLTALPPRTSAGAEEATDQRSLEEKVMSIFVSGLEVSTSAGFPVCKDYPALGQPYRTCGGEVKTTTPGALELDVRVTFPKNVSGPLPLVILLHSWGGNRNQMQGGGGDPPDKPESLLSPIRFLEQGYAVVSYTARGWQASCGTADPIHDVIAVSGTDSPSEECLEGYTHLAERRFEVADAQYLLGVLVDAGVADQRRLAAAGSSYGAGQTWLLATSMPWMTPADKGPIQLAAAVPLSGWTDLYGAFAPNGRATDGIDQSASHQEPPGVVKPLHLNDTYRAGHTSGARYNSTKPEEEHSHFEGWAAVFNAGEPHDTAKARDLPNAFRGKSAYYPVADPENDYLTQLAARRVAPVPIFAVQGWTDAFFPAVEALQMYRRLKASHAGYPIKLLLGDLGHGSQNPAQQVNYTWDQVRSFIDARLGVAADNVPAAASFPTLCPAGEDKHVPVTAENWDVLVKENHITFSSREGDGRRTDSSSSNIGEEVASDPTLVSTEVPPDSVLPATSPIDPFPSAGACVTRDGAASASGESWRWTVTDGFTMLGLPTVSLPYDMDGQDATVVAKLWDVAPDGMTKVLVTRGVYRLSAPGDAASGVLEFQLFGNHWRFGPGHTIELEVGQRDLPFLRPDNLPSTITYVGVELSVPQAKS